MRTALIALISLLFFSCTNENTRQTRKPKEEKNSFVHNANFQTILDDAQLNGLILIFDAQEKLYHSNNDSLCNKGQIPASTFKIPNSIIALETGVVEDENTIFKWDGTERSFPAWEQDLTLKDAFRYSCVPCYQEVARDIGAQRMRQYLDKLDYGSIQFDSTTIDNFWLVGASKITPLEQIEFLQRLYQAELPIAQKTEKIMKDIMLVEQKEDYKLFGKTGWSVNREENNGWFVGYLEREGKVYYFATNIEPKATFNMDSFPSARKKVTYEALQSMGLIKD